MRPNKLIRICLRQDIPACSDIYIQGQEHLKCVLLHFLLQKRRNYVKKVL